MRTRAAGSSHENCCFMGQFRKFMTIQPIFDATDQGCTYPDNWGNSGVMTFIINQQGRVYQKDLGPNTGTLAPAMTEYNPDPTWKLVEVQP